MNELEIVILIVFSINCILNVLVIAYFRTIVREEKHLDEIIMKASTYYYEASKYWHNYLRMREREREKEK